MTMMKHYNIKRQNMTKPAAYSDGKSRTDKIELMKKSIKKQQEVFTHYKKYLELLTKLSFTVCELIV